MVSDETTRLLTTITAEAVGDGLSTSGYHSDLLGCASDLEICAGDDNIVAVCRASVVTAVVAMAERLG